MVCARTERRNFWNNFCARILSISLRFVNGIEIEIHFVCSLFSVQSKGKNVVNENFNFVC